MTDERLKELAEFWAVCPAHLGFTVGCQSCRDSAKAGEALARRVRDETAREAREQAIGWAWTEACIQLDNGLDPRGYEMPKLMERAVYDLGTDEPTVPVPVSENDGSDHLARVGPDSSGEHGAPELEHESWCHAVMNECNCGAESAAEEDG